MRAFEEQVRRYQDRVYGYAFYLLGRRAEAEDVTQEALLCLWENRRSVDEEKVLGWLLRVTRNACIDALRRRSTRRRFFLADSDGLAEAPSHRPAPDADAQAEDLQRHLERALRRMDEPYRSIVILREIQQLQYKEICTALGLPMNTVKVYLHRARKQLRHHVAEATNHELA